MAWHHFSSYKKKFISFKYGEYHINLVVRHRISKFLPKIEILLTWHCEEMPGTYYKIVTHLNLHERSIYKEPFKKLRLSLSYGTNVNARGVMDKLMMANKNKIPHTAHRRTSKA